MTDWITELKEKLSKPGVIELEEVKPIMLKLIAEIERLEEEKNKTLGYFGEKE